LLVRESLLPPDAPPGAVRGGVPRRAFGPTPSLPSWGLVDKAVEWQTKALAGAPATEQDQSRNRLKLYQEQQPYRLK